MSTASIRGVELRTIPSWPSYAGGSDGHVYRTEDSPNRRAEWAIPYRLRETPHHTNGRPYVTVLRLDPVTGKKLKRPQPVHKLIAEAWYGPCPAGHEVDHQNQRRTDNRPANLEYVTPPLNNERAGKRPPRPARPPRPLTAEEVLELRANVAAGTSIYCEAQRLRKSYRTVWLAARGVTYRGVA